MGSIRISYTASADRQTDRQTDRSYVLEGLMVMRFPGRAWLLAAMVLLNPASANQQIVFAIDSTLTTDELNTTHRLVNDALQRADIESRAGMIFFDSVVTQIIPLQENTDTFRTLVKSSMAAAIADRMADPQNEMSQPAIGIERSIAEFNMNGGIASWTLVLFTDESRLDATTEEINKQLQWLSVILLPELEGVDGELLLVTSHGTTENRLVNTVHGVGRNAHLALSENNRIVDHIVSTVSTLQEPTATQTELEQTEAGPSNTQSESHSPAAGTLLGDESIASESVAVESGAPPFSAGINAGATAEPDDFAEPAPVAGGISLAETSTVLPGVQADSGVANQPGNITALDRSLTFFSTHLPVALPVGLLAVAVLLAYAALRKISHRQDARPSPPPHPADSTDEYLPLSMTRQRHFSREIQHNRNRTLRPSTYGTAGTSSREQGSEADPLGEADTVVRTRPR
ncbi:MAG: hypothetical protein AB8B63_10150 [Granulosicoccus sp.]